MKATNLKRLIEVADRLDHRSLKSSRLIDGVIKLYAQEAFSEIAEWKYPYSLPKLPYGYDALEPVIDKKTMEIHYKKHHGAYTDNLNGALRSHRDLHDKTLIQLLTELDQLPEEIQTKVRNNGGGYFNHCLFWGFMTPTPDAQKKPTDELEEAIERDFESFDDFKEQFSESARTVFGSGWAWLVVNDSGTLQIIQTANQDSPVMQGLKPVLGIDVWEHAYYLKYQNKRADYIDNFWKIINWEHCTHNFLL